MRETEFDLFCLPFSGASAYSYKPFADHAPSGLRLIPLELPGRGRRLREPPRYETVTFHECLSKRLNVMDATAFSLCMDNHIPIIIFDLGPEGNLSHALRGEQIGTLVHGE